MKIRGNTISTTMKPDKMAERIGGGAEKIIQSASGNVITLKDSSNSKLQGFLLFGTEKTASAESVTVSVMGKNLCDYRKAHARRSDEKVTIDERINGVYWTGTYYFIVPVSIPAGTSFRVSCQMESVDGSYNSWFDRCDYEYTDGTSEYIDIREPKIPKKDVKAVRIYKRNTADNNQVIVWDLQLEIGTAVTEYEPYKEAQTLVVPTPNGLQTGEVLEVADANTLHTHKPNTTIINDAGAEMFVEYVADTKTYIDNKFTELQNAILSAGANV